MRTKEAGEIVYKDGYIKREDAVTATANLDGQSMGYMG